MCTRKLTLVLVPVLSLVCPNLEAAGPVDNTLAAADRWCDGQTSEALPTSAEIMSKRTLTAKHFTNQDGTHTAVISCAPVHYWNHNEWCDIDTRIVELGNHPDYLFCNTTNIIHNYFPATSSGASGMMLTYEDIDLTHWLEVRLSWTDPSGFEHQVCQASPTEAKVVGNKVIFRDCFADLDVEFTVTNLGLSRDLVFKQAPACVAGAEAGSWLNIVERLILPASHHLAVAGERQSADFSATDWVQIRDGQGSGFVTMDPLRITRGSGDRSSQLRKARRLFRFVDDSLYCYNQIPIECLGGKDTLTAVDSGRDRGSGDVRASTVLRPANTMWWTGWMDPDWFGDPPYYGCGDADIIVGTPDLQPPFYEYRGWAKFDVRSIEGDVTDSRLDLYLFMVAFGDVPYISVDYYSIDSIDPETAHASTADVLLLYADCQNGTQYYNNRPWYTYPTWTGDVDLGPTADAHIENPPVGDGTWWAVGFSSNTSAGCPDYCGDAVKARGYNGGAEAPKLTVTYTPPCTPPSITSHPSDQTVCEGGAAMFSVAANGTPPLTYKWRKNGGDIPGATGSSYTIDPVEAGDAGTYDVVVSNDCGSVTSAPAMLTVISTTSGDVNHDGALDGADIAAFLNVIFNSPSGPPSESFCAADMDGNGTVNLDDVQPFVVGLLGP